MAFFMTPSFEKLEVSIGFSIVRQGRLSFREQALNYANTPPPLFSPHDVIVATMVGLCLSDKLSKYVDHGLIR